jgi:hypothetical protein
VEKEELGWWLQITGQHYREKLMKHIQRDRKHIIWVWFAVAACFLSVAGAFCIGVAVGRMRGPSEYAQQPPSAQYDTQEGGPPELSDSEFIDIRDSLREQVPWLLTYAQAVINMQRSARNTYDELKNDPTIAPDVVALYADTLTWESPRKSVRDLHHGLRRAQFALRDLEIAYRNLFRTDFFEGVTIEERKRYKAMNSPASQPAREDVDNVPSAETKETP